MEYWVLSEDTLEEVLPKIALDKVWFGRSGEAEALIRYFERELNDAQNRDAHLVVYKKDGMWKHVCISREYNVDFVMKQAEELL